MSVMSQEKKFLDILLKYLPENKYVDLDNSFITRYLKKNKIKVNYDENESIWFFRVAHINYGTLYCFGLNEESDIKLIFNYQKTKSKSSLKFFKTGNIGIEIKFTGNIHDNFVFIKENFNLKSPLNNRNKYFIMLFDNDEYGIISVISKLIRFVDSEFSLKRDIVLIKECYEITDETKNLNQKITVDNDLEINKPILKEETISENLDSSQQIDKDKTQYNINDLKVSKFIFDESSVTKVISKIELNNFQQGTLEDDLLEQFQEFKNLPIFNSISSEFEDYEISPLIIRIEEDIKSEMISGEIFDIINFYFDRYKSIKRHFCLNSSFEKIINTDLFNNIFNNLKYSNDILLRLTDSIKEDINNDNIMDEDDLILKLKNYLKREQVKTNFYKDLSERKTKASVISIRYNLTTLEVNHIFNIIEKDIIDDNIYNDSIKDHLDKKLEEMVELNQSKARMKFNNVLKMETVKELIGDNEELLDKLNYEIGGLINLNNLKSDEITEEFVINKIKHYEDE